MLCSVVHIQPFSAAARIKIRTQNPGDRERSSGFSYNCADKFVRYNFLDEVYDNCRDCCLTMVRLRRQRAVDRDVVALAHQLLKAHQLHAELLRTFLGDERTVSQNLHVKAGELFATARGMRPKPIRPTVLPAVRYMGFVIT